MKVTKHAIERGEERLNLNEDSMTKLSKKALEKGIQHKETSGSLKRYLDKLYLSHGNANNIRLYGEQVYIFANTTLITVFNLPNEYKKILNKLR